MDTTDDTMSSFSDNEIYQILKNGTMNERLQEKFKSAPKVMIGQHQLMFEIGDIDEHFRKKAEEELRETPEVVAQGLKELKELVAGEPNLCVINDDIFYTIFLRPCKWYAQGAFSLMKRHFRFHQNYSHVCADLMPTKTKAAICNSLIYPLPLRGTDGSRIFIIELGKRWKPKEVSLTDVFQGLLLNTCAAMLEPKTQIAGGRVIIDFEGFSLSQVTHFSPSFAKMVVDYVQKALTSRLKSIHIINQTVLFNMIFVFFKPLLEEKFRNRIHFHGSEREYLMTFIDKSVLPTKYGGELDLNNMSFGEDVWKLFCSFELFFAVYKKLGYKDEKKK